MRAGRIADNRSSFVRFRAGEAAEVLSGFRRVFFYRGFFQHSSIPQKACTAQCSGARPFPLLPCRRRHSHRGPCDTFRASCMPPLTQASKCCATSSRPASSCWSVPRLGHSHSTAKSHLCPHLLEQTGGALRRKRTVCAWLRTSLSAPYKTSR